MLKTGQITAFVAGLAIANRFNVPRSQAFGDAALAGFIGKPMFGILLVAALAPRQGAAAATSASTTPSIVGLSPDFGPAGQPVTITGANFGADAKNVAVIFGSTAADNVNLEDPGTITAEVPEMNAQVNQDVNITVSVGNVASSPAIFTVTPDV
jgi:hypothetical protein